MTDDKNTSAFYFLDKLGISAQPVDDECPRELLILPPLIISPKKTQTQFSDWQMITFVKHARPLEQDKRTDSQTNSEKHRKTDRLTD